MRTCRHNVSTCARLQLSLTVGLFLACAANFVLVCAWL